MSLRECAKEVLDEMREGECWLAVWKIGRHWRVMSFYPVYDPETGEFESDESMDLFVPVILREDAEAVIVNSYYTSMGEMDSMSVADLAGVLRWNYDNGFGVKLRCLRRGKHE